MISPYKTAQYEHNGRTHAVVDRRTSNGIPFLHERAWYDSFEAAQRFDHELYGRPTMETVQEAAATADRKREAMRVGPEYAI
jgi:hypothetical protein